MATIVNTNLAGFTVDYNSVQFGGADAAYKSFPPNYRFVAEEVWDDSHRAVMAIRCLLRLSCVFYETSETLMSANMRTIRLALEQPGKTLKLSGLGSGFDWIGGAVANLPGDMKDIAGGPFPMPVEMTPIGQLCWELNWGIQFEVSNCSNYLFSIDPLSFTSFNFTTTWRNDFEGYSTRVIQGKATIPFIRNPVSPKTIAHIAEETRGNILIKVPDGFKRVENTWNEGVDRRSLEFTIVDEQLNGDPYPAGITQADGMFSLNTGSKQQNAMNQAVATLTCSFKTAYNQPKNLAGKVFLAMVLSKQADIQTQQAALKAAWDALPASDPDPNVKTKANTPRVPDGVILPLAFSIQNGKFDSARLTQASVSWYLQQDFNSILAASKIFEPVPGVAQDYTTWKTSMSALWGNRGVSLYQSDPAESVIIDLCDDKTAVSIGNTTASPNTPVNATVNSLTCPNIPANGGWLHFDLDIKILRQEEVSRHIQAASYIPTLGQVAYDYTQQPANTTSAVAIGGPDYSQSASDQETSEYHGYPRFLIGVAFSGVRFKLPPFVPEIRKVNNMVVRPYGKQEVGSPKHVMDSFGCPIWSVSGYRVYSVPGLVSAVKPVDRFIAAEAASNPTILLDL